MDTDTINKLAGLVYLSLAEGEACSLAADLTLMEKQAGILSVVDTEQAEPLFHFSEGFLREDVLGPTLPPEALSILSGYNAESGYFSVPPIF